MELFSYEEIFCKHYKFLRENVEVFVSFNNDHCQSILIMITSSYPFTTTINWMLKMKRVD